MLPPHLRSPIVARAEEVSDKGSNSRHGVPGLVLFLIVVIIFVILGVVTWIVVTQLRARRLGLPRPRLTSYIPFYKGSSSAGGYPSSSGGGGGGGGGVVGWITDKFHTIKDRRSRTAGGAYEEPLNNVGRGRPSNRAGFGALDPDEAWDARVGTEADAYGPGGYYEEQEVGLHDDGGGASGPYGGAGYGGPARAAAETSHAELPGYGDDGRDRGRSRSRDSDPFSDHQAERSSINLRGVSPRPMDPHPGPSKP